MNEQVDMSLVVGILITIGLFCILQRNGDCLRLFQPYVGGDG